ncbi:MAG TPA: acyl-CoA dehydrogenase family protein [Acidimicrobiales bacterium]|jgi:alkylation response protein AidB-like acyl-CoA dehydrogenase|nr:acyl-CoA dehydrogenase family protein [Acidimicrobiales bacterium]
MTDVSERDLNEQVADARTTLDAFLRENLPAEWVAAIDAGDSDALAKARPQLDLDDWWIRLADAGYVTPGWPREYGGLDAPGPVAAAISRKLSEFKVPRFTNPIGINLAGPAILRWGTTAQKERLLRPIARHQEIWCQMFSEPGSGSDLAGLSTRATRDGDLWHVNGQKVWTSYAHIATWGMLLTRTNPDVPKHDGITVFVMPVKQPGVEVRPLHHITGDAEFNEVFFNDAEVGDEWRLSEVDDGWRVVVSILMNERQAGSGGGSALPGTVTGRSVDSLIRRHAPIADDVLRQRLAQAYIEDKIVQITNQRASARRRAGQGPGSEGSIMKLFHSEHTQRLHDLASDLEGLYGQAWPEEDRWLKNTAWSYLRVRSKTIAGGTSEIQRNIIGERILGLPKEQDLSKVLAWKDVPRS